jgi:hypothetical protein
MTITLVIDDAAAPAGIQTIMKALNISGVTTEEGRIHLANHLKDVTARLYVQGDQMKRVEQDNSQAINAAATYITVS